jgi:hypothetical protein
MRNIYPLQRTRAWRSYLGGAMLDAFFRGLFILECDGILSDCMDSRKVEKGDQIFVAASVPTIRFESNSPMRILLFGGPR